MPVSLPFKSGIAKPTADGSARRRGICSAMRRGPDKHRHEAVLHPLIVRVGMDLSSALFDAELFVQHLATGARQFVVQTGVRDALHAGSELVVVHTEHAVRSAPSFAGALSTTFWCRPQIVVTWLAVLRPRGEQAGAFDHNVGLQLGPRQLGGP